MKEIRRSDAEYIRNAVEEALESLGERLGVKFSVGRTTFSPDSLTCKVEASLLTESGKKVVSDSTHTYVDRVMESMGVKFVGHFIGSVWKIKDDVYQITDYTRRNRKYPIIAIENGGRKVKMVPNSFLRATQLKEPTQTSFIKWFTIDTEDDCVRESDVEICDEVQAYFEAVLTEEQCGSFIDRVVELLEEGNADVDTAMDVWDAYSTKGIDAAIEKLNPTKRRK